MLALHELISFLTGLRYKGMEGEGRAGRQAGRQGGCWAAGPKVVCVTLGLSSSLFPGTFCVRGRGGGVGGLADLTCAGSPTGRSGWTRAAVHVRERMHVKTIPPARCKSLEVCRGFCGRAGSLSASQPFAALASHSAAQS